MHHRNSIYYLDRAKVRKNGNRIVYIQAESGVEKYFNIPHVNCAVLMLGPGSSISVEASRLLSDENIFLVMCGTGGTPLFYGSLAIYQITKWFNLFVPIYQDTERSLIAAKEIMLHRVENMQNIAIPSINSLNYETIDHEKIVKQIQSNGEAFKQKIYNAEFSQELLGYEGQFTKATYQIFSQNTIKDNDFKRVHGGSNEDGNDLTTRVKNINGFIDHGNYLAYGLAGCVLWTLGISPSMSVLHGKTRAGGLIFDLADSIKDSIVLPAAFSNNKSEKEFRTKVISVIHDKGIMKILFNTMEKVIQEASIERVYDNK